MSILALLRCLCTGVMGFRLWSPHISYGAKYSLCSSLLALVLSWPLRFAVTVTGHGGPLVDGCVLTAAARANNGEQLALADGFGRVRLLRYPAVNDDQVSGS